MIRFPFQEALAPLCGLVWLSNPSRRARAGRRTRAPTFATTLALSHTRTLHARIPIPSLCSRPKPAQVSGAWSLGSSSPFSLDNFSFIASPSWQSYCAFNHSADTITTSGTHITNFSFYSRTYLHLSDYLNCLDGLFCVYRVRLLLLLDPCLAALEFSRNVSGWCALLLSPPSPARARTRMSPDVVVHCTGNLHLHCVPACVFAVGHTPDDTS